MMRILAPAALIAGLIVAASAHPEAQSIASPVAPATALDEPKPFEITDNSFLIEEAFNQERGIFQNIFTGIADGAGGWQAAFTQEWPLGGQRNQLSYTVPFSVVDGREGFADLLINYRYQALTETRRRPAFSPRVSLIVPNGRQEDGFGNGVIAWQVNLPFSKQFDDVYLHWNAGLTYSPGVHAPGTPNGPGANLVSPTGGVSGIVRVRPMLHVMCEVVAARIETLDDQGVAHQAALTVAPGLRGGWNLGEKQVVIGAALPVTFTSDRSRIGLLTYFSYELPFRSK